MHHVLSKTYSVANGKIVAVALPPDLQRVEDAVIVAINLCADKAVSAPDCHSHITLASCLTALYKAQATLHRS